HMGLARGRMDAEFHEMSAERGLLILFVEVAIFHRVLCGQAALTRGFGKGCLAIPCSHFTVRENRLGGIETELLRHRLTQLHTRRVNAGGRAVAAPLSAGAT